MAMAELIILFISLQILSFIMTNTNSYSLSTTTTTCPSYTCNSNNQFTIRYPFYEFTSLNPPTQYCGYPQFALSCSPSNETILFLASETYIVKYIDYASNTLTLIDADLPVSDCPRANHNVSLTFFTLLNFSPVNLNLTFYFNCTVSDAVVNLPYIRCLLSGTVDPRRSYVFLPGNETEGYGWASMCEEKVVVPVMKDKINVDDLIGGFGLAVKQGFKVEWSTGKECDSCEKNGGRCGYSHTRSNFLCHCENGDISFDSCRGLGLDMWLKLALGVIPVALICVGFIMICCLLRKSISKLPKIFTRNKGRDWDFDEIIKNYGSLSPKQFVYSDVKRMTNSFRDKLGEGGFGCVYKGKLSDGRLVAVKILNKSKGNGEEFLNEVASISRTSHVNVVSLLGFCYNGTKRALIYEFMPNGSLDKYIHNTPSLSTSSCQLERTTLSKIAIGIARGLDYLHSGCNTRILHLDIKPNNILLDQDMCPKISDFGLAKLGKRKESIISMVGTRGTIGYIAPEVFSRAFGNVSYKSDVYSYGMMILEMAGEGRKMEVGGLTETSQMYFPNYIYSKIEADPDGMALKENGITGKDDKIERKMILVGLWCIQTKPADRPSMAKVVEMLEGSIESIQIPPKPILSSSTVTSPIQYISSNVSSSSQISDHKS